MMSTLPTCVEVGTNSKTDYRLETDAKSLEAKVLVDDQAKEEKKRIFSCDKMCEVEIFRKISLQRVMKNSSTYCVAQYYVL